MSSFAGNYVLAYLGRNGGGVYGVSAPFPVRYGHTAMLAALVLDGAPAAELERRPLLPARGGGGGGGGGGVEPEEAEEALEREHGDAQGPVEGRPLLDGNPGPPRAAAGGAEEEGVPRRRATAAESQSVETPDQLERRDE